jgi:hypothetical protein
MTSALVDYRPIGAEFLETAPVHYHVESTTRLPRMQVWEAFAGYESWPEWFPQCERVVYEGKLPPGVGTIRRSWFGGTTFEETMLIWEPGASWGYRIDRSTVRIAQAQFELTEFRDHPDGGTRVLWHMASEPTAELNYLASDKDAKFETFLKDMLDTALVQLESYLQRQGAV